MCPDQHDTFSWQQHDMFTYQSHFLLAGLFFRSESPMTSRTDADSCNQETDDSCHKAAAVLSDTEGGGGLTTLVGGDSHSGKEVSSTQLTSTNERKYECQREYKVKDCAAFVVTVIGRHCHMTCF